MLLTGRRSRGKGNLPIPSEFEKPMSKQAERGTKRHCQNADCRGHFYDLNRTPIVCPLCSETFEIAPPPMKAAPKPVPEKKPVAPAEPPPPATMDADAEKDAPEQEDEAAIADVEPVEDEIDGADEDNTFLEEESEEGGDVSGIVGTPAKKNEEES